MNEELMSEEDLMSQEFAEYVDDEDRSSSEPEFDPDEEDEGIEDYIIGGYHPTHIGQILFNRYVILQKLGWGRFSTAWLAKDFKHNSFVAIKIQKSSSQSYLESALDEVEILQKVQRQIHNPDWISSLKEYYPIKQLSPQDTPVVSLLNCFVHKGPYGSHFCLSFEVLGVSLYEIGKRYNNRGIPLDLCKSIAKQVLVGLDFLHRMCGVIHTDLKPENVLVCLTDKEIKDIFEEGRIKQTQAFEQRVREYQQAHGIKINSSKQADCKMTQEISALESRIEVLQSEYNLKAASFTKCRKKNMRRTINKLKQRVICMRSKLATSHRIEGGLRLLNFDRPKNTFKGWRGNKLTTDVRVKIADLGNASWKHHHFASLIQTRHYRSPEVIVGMTYGPSADIWSFGCMLYELLTGNVLFHPQRQANWSKNKHHLALMQQLLGRFPQEFVYAGTKSKHYFERNGSVRGFRQVAQSGISKILCKQQQVQQQRFSILPAEAKAFEKFLLPMLRYSPTQRISAREALKSDWLICKGQLYKMSDWQVQDYMREYQEPERNLAELRSSECEADVEDPNLEEQVKDERYPININLIDVSFSDLGYVGYSDGLNLGQLDAQANWQFT